jgi:hypothetical protein
MVIQSTEITIYSENSKLVISRPTPGNRFFSKEEIIIPKEQIEWFIEQVKKVSDSIQGDE